MVYNTRSSKENKENANTGVKIKINVRVRLSRLATTKYFIFNVAGDINVLQVSSIYIFLLPPHHNPCKRKKKKSLSLLHYIVTVYQFRSKLTPPPKKRTVRETIFAHTDRHSIALRDIGLPTYCLANYIFSYFQTSKHFLLLYYIRVLTYIYHNFSSWKWYATSYPKR